MNEQDILDWLEENYDRNPDAGVLVYYREDVLEKLIKMQKRIAELEQNLGLIKLGIEQQHKQLISCETALDERNDKVSLQESRIAELEKQLATAEKVVLSYDMSFKERDIRDLEQQAKGIRSAMELLFASGKINTTAYDIGMDYAEGLEQQAKQLREGVNHE